MRRRQCRRGVTMIELLVAITLVSFVAAGILFAMNLGFSTLDRTTRRLHANRRVLGAQRVLEQQLAGIVPALAPCAGRPDAPGQLFFSGETQSMRFVSSYTLEEAARGYPRIVEYLVIPGDQAAGVRLVMQEIPYTGPYSVRPFCAGQGFDPILNGPVALQRPVALGPRPFVLADRLTYCRLSYLRADARTGRRTWEARYAAAVLPAAVRVDMMPSEFKPGEVQVGPVTVPIRVSRTSVHTYEDIEPEQQQ